MVPLMRLIPVKKKINPTTKGTSEENWFMDTLPTESPPAKKA